MKTNHSILFHSPPGDSFLSLERLLKAWGYEITFASKASELKEMIKKRDFELVVIASSKEAKKLLLPETQNFSHLRLSEVEKRCIMEALSITGGNKSRAAKILGVDTKTLYNKLRSYSIGKPGGKKGKR